MANSNGTVELNGTPLEGGPGKDGSENRDWLSLAIRAYDDGRNYFQTELSKRVRQAMDHFNNKHAAGSKFASPTFPSQRSSLFRPKTRQLANKFLAQGANAFFATSDVVQVEAANKGDKDQAEAAKFRRAILNHRLSKTIPWFKLLSSAIVDADNLGVAILRQWWKRQRKYIHVVQNGKYAENVDNSIDHAYSSLVPIEAFILHPQCDWMDPIGSSPYVIHRDNMHIDDLLVAMAVRKEEEDAANGRDLYGVPYVQMTRSELERHVKSGDASEDSGERSKRNAGRSDQEQQSVSDKRFGTLRVWRVIYREDGIDWYFETLGRNAMLSEPVPLSIAQFGYPKRPYQMGSVWVSPNSVYPEGSSGLISQLQVELNENVNQRIDNLRQQTNARHLVRRGSAIDLNSLLRNIPGGVVMTGDPNNDVRPLVTKEFGPSVYGEADRINVEMDDLAGAFGGASVSSNQQLNKTVGGMDLLGENANVMSEYKLRCISESLIEPALRQLDELNAMFETDEQVIAICLSDAMIELDPDIQAQIDQQFPQPAPQEPPAEGQPPQPPQDPNKPARDEAVKKAMQEKALRLFRAAVNISVSVGFGNTSPQKRIEKLSTALSTIQAFAPQMMAGADVSEIAKEVLGAIGYDNGSRLFPALRGNENPMIAVLQQQVQALQQQLDSNMAKEQVKEKIAQIQAQTALQIAQIRSTDVKQVETMRLQLKAREMQMRQRIAEIELQLKSATTDTDRQRLYMEREALSHSIISSERAWDLQMQQIDEQKQAVISAHQAQLAQNLMSPGSGAVEDPFPDGSAPVVGGGSDRAGVIARGGFGAIPNSGA